MKTSKIYKVIYIPTDTVVYVGQTRGSKEKRLSEHARDGFAIGEAIRKLGKSNFKTEYLAVELDKNEADRLEKFYISEFRTLVDHGIGYNKTSGGSSFFQHSPETVEQHRKRMTGSGNPMFGKSGEKAPMYGKARPEHSEFMKKYRKQNSNPWFIADEKNPLRGATRPDVSQRMKGANNPFYRGVGEPWKDIGIPRWRYYDLKRKGKL